MSTQEELVSFIAEFSHDPLGFVLACFPWGEGELVGYESPDPWQVRILNMIRDGLPLDKAIKIAVASGHGIGKGCTYDTHIDTPTGDRRWGDLKVGDYVFDGKGRPTKILQLHPYKQLDHYRVTFDDDSYCDVSGEHLWNVKGRQQRRKKMDWITLSTTEIIEKGVLRKNGKAMAKQWEIPIQGAAEFPKKKVPIHPYLMGVWLGDGCRNSPYYYKPYPEIKEKIISVGHDAYFLSDNAKVRVSDLKNMPKDLYEKYCYEKYIPIDYKYNDVQSRRDLLCGLLDTDGEINKNGSILYSTTSKQLADDVVWLVRSLGGKAQIQPTNKSAFYYKDENERVYCKECYRITMTLPFNPFTIEHRKVRYKPVVEHRYRTRWISSIEPIGKRDGMCITVENEDGLYLANDFIVTHNSALVSWLILWAISTHEDTRGVVTANTEGQLRSKTWAELSKWYRMFIGKDFFKLTATAIFSAQAEHEKTWRIDAIPWSKENPEAFAGLHNQGKRILVIFDEASAIYNEIWTVTEGAMTDANTEIVWCAFGNPTRNDGRFYDCFNSLANVWETVQIDSRNVAISNKAILQQWVDAYGEDSDFVKVRVRGVFPSASSNQLISRDLADEAWMRKPEKNQYTWSAAIIGVDPAWSGMDMLAIVLRQGIYTRVLKKMPKNENDMEVARIIASYQDKYNASAVFIDMGYGTGIFSAGKDMGRMNWRLVPFGSKSDKEEFANKRAEMWFALKDWLKEGGCIDGEELRDELCGPEAFINRKGKHQLESKDDMKRRGVPSPNLADALALTFAFPVNVSFNADYKRKRAQGKLPKWGAM